MGWEQIEVKIFAAVSRHNSDADDRDNALWRDLAGRIAEVAADPKYAPINVDVVGLDWLDE